MTTEGPYATSSSDPHFYIPGGTLPSKAQCYVERHADTELYTNLTQGKYCYVLTARQVGKSSLMVRVAARLEREGVAVAVLDLTGSGQNLTADQWYYGLLDKTGQRLKLEDELEDYWVKHTALGPLSRWMGAIRSVVLDRYPGKIVIFIDEVDQVRSLPFSTDEFFAGIREFHNRRQLDQDLNRLTFCLLGAARPSDLVKDPRTAPFNIAKRIDLTDFTESEAGPLAIGLSHEDNSGDALIKRVLYWTGGHPYLTQSLCQALAEEGSVRGDDGVDRVCERLFLSPSAREKDDNLQYVSKRILDKNEDNAGLLTLYSKVHKHRCADEQRSSVTKLWHRNMSIEKDKSSLQELLEITGIIRLVAKCLRVRNRVYHRVFDRRWVSENMPQNELTRQIAAYRKRLLRVAAIAGFLILVIGSSAVYAFIQNKRVEDAGVKAQSERQTALTALAALEQTQEEAIKEATHARVQELMKDEAVRDANYKEWQTKLMTWQMIMNDTNPRTFEAYLQVDGEGEFALKARHRLRTLRAAPSSTAQLNGVIRGRIYDAGTGKNVDGAKLIAKRKDVDWELTMFSNQSGEYMLAPMPIGPYLITISSEDYADLRFTLEVDTESTNTIKQKSIGLSRKQ